ncbi:hypothetical protein GKZ89_14085 [Bacillus mangrovi]|uniref:Uncharacterized protein n=1 Tax=Metabacillus mangrovi TaxID=1491830 RepID=A0A7X2S6S1_9BACI|nr:hypothetical protein [Metabacillus mangrovi]MTH54530.1 hypothetical protein [Metabacillus mangrovi]
MQRMEFLSDLTVDKMRKDLHELIAKLHRVGINTEKLEPIYSNLNALSLFSDRQIVSVTGLQSVGKTYLIKRALGLPEDLLLSEVGVGEKRPVLISSRDDIHEMQFFSSKSIRNESGSMDVVKSPITKDELNKNVQNPSSDMLWFEIVLPDGKQLGHLTLALLPGFERKGESDSQRFLDLFLNCSSGMILVLNHMRLAQRDQELLLKKVSDIYRDKEPGFVLTHANELSEENRKSLVDNLASKFTIMNQDQIVYADKSIESVPGDIERLIKQNSRFTYDSLGLHYKKLLEVGQTLSNVLSEIESVVNAKYTANENANEIRIMQREFNKYREQYSSDLKKDLRLAMDQHLKKCDQEVIRDLRNEENRWYKKISTAFKSDLTFNEKQEILDWVKNIYSTPEPDKLNQIVLQSIDGVTKKKARKYEKLGIKSINSLEKHEGTDAKMSLSFMNRNSKNSDRPSGNDDESFINKEIVNTLKEIESYLNPQESYRTLTDQNLRYMPIIAGAISQHIITSKSVLELNGITEKEMNDYQTLKEKAGDVDLFKEEVNNLAIDMKHMVAGTAVFFGIDAIDGEFNSFGAALSALKALGITGSIATGITAGSFAALTVAFAMKKGAEKLERYKFERQDYAHHVLKAAGDYQVESIVNLVNEVMEEMEDQLVMVHQARLQSKVNIPIYEEIAIRIGRLNNDCGKLNEVAYRNAAFIN